MNIAHKPPEIKAGQHTGLKLKLDNRFHGVAPQNTKLLKAFSHFVTQIKLCIKKMPCICILLTVLELVEAAFERTGAASLWGAFLPTFHNYRLKICAVSFQSLKLER